MSTQIIERPENSVSASHQIPSSSPVGMMLAAVQQGIPLEQVEKMMDLQERWEQREAEKAFNDAMSAFKAEAVEIIKRTRVSFPSKGGQTDYTHADLSDVVEAVGPALSRHGFAWSWKTEQSNGAIRVTCILKHRQGHSDSVSLIAPPDQSGGKNAIQAIASTVTYLERYTLKAVTGVSEKGDDDDGLAGGQAQQQVEAKITAVQAKHLDSLLARCSAKAQDAFRGLYGSTSEVGKSEFDRVLGGLQKSAKLNEEATDGDRS